MSADYKLCEQYVRKLDDYPLCNRPATYVVVNGSITEYLCTQHANKCIKIGLAPHVTITKIDK